MKQRYIYIALISLITACGGGSGGNDAGNNEPAPSENTSPPPQNNAGSFGEPNDSQIRPGVVVTAAGSQCTSNFLYTDNRGDYYLGTAAHCFSPDSNSGIDPCVAQNEALGTEVEIQNAAFVGSLVYSSWQTMKEANEEAGSGICLGNDFAVIKLDRRDHDNIHPAARVFGGPTALFKGSGNPGDGVFTYGQSPLNFGLTQAKQGTIESLSEDGWIYTVTLDSPGVPGDSGSAVLHESGQAIGILSTLGACVGLCAPTSNGVANLEMALSYANATTFNGRLRLVTWSNFTP